MASVNVVGVGMVPFGKHPEKSLIELGVPLSLFGTEGCGVQSQTG